MCTSKCHKTIVWDFLSTPSSLCVCGNSRKEHHVRGSAKAGDKKLCFSLSHSLFFSLFLILFSSTSLLKSKWEGEDGGWKCAVHTKSHENYLGFSRIIVNSIYLVECRHTQTWRHRRGEDKLSGEDFIL